MEGKLKTLRAIGYFKNGDISLPFFDYRDSLVGPQFLVISSVGELMWVKIDKDLIVRN